MARSRQQKYSMLLAAASAVAVSTLGVSGAFAGVANNWELTAGGNSNTAANWTLNRVPVDGDDAAFNLPGSAYTVDIPSHLLSDKIQVGNNLVTLRFTNNRAWTLNHNPATEAGNSLVLGTASGHNARLTLVGDGVEGYVVGNTGQTISIGNAAGSSGTLSLQGGGNLNFSGAMNIGVAGSGTFNVTGGGTAITGTTVVGNTTTGNSASVADAGSAWTVNGNLTTGSVGGGQGSVALGTGATLTVSGATNLINGDLALTGATFTTGSLARTNGSVLWNSGTIKVTNSTLNIGPGTALGAFVNTTSAHHLDVTQTLQINSNQTTLGRLVIDGGSIKAGSVVNNGQIRSDVLNAVITANNTTNNNRIDGSIRFTGTLTNASAGLITPGVGATFETGGLVTNNGTIDVDGGTARFTGGVNNRGILRADVSTGSQFFGAIHNLAAGGEGGPAAGQILVNGSSPGGATATFNGVVDNDGILRIEDDALFKANVTGSGDFTATGVAIFEATYNPDPSSGGVLFNGSVRTQGANGQLVLDIGGTSPGTQYDNVNIIGTANLTEVDVLLASGYVPKLGDKFVLISTVGGINWVGGTREQVVNLPDLPGNLDWQFCPDTDCLSLTVVPEPASMALVGMAVLGLGARRRRR